MILHSAISGKKLSWDTVLINSKIRFWKRVSSIAKGAKPDSTLVIDPGIRVQNGAALGANQRVIGKYRELTELS